MNDPSVAEPVPKRAAKLVVGDRIPPTSLPTSFFSEPGEVVFIRTYSYRGEDFVFIAYWQEVGYDSATYVASNDVEVYPADPTGLGYSRADDDETTQPIAGRVPAHFGAVEVAGGLVDIDPPASKRTDMTGAAVTQNCVFVGDVGGWCNTHEAVHIAVSEGECGCPVYPYMGRGDTADTIIDHRRSCLASAD